MNNYFFRPFQALPQQIPGGLRGAIFEDENGDFNIYINQDLCVHCYSCIEVCPFGAIKEVEING